MADHYHFPRTRVRERINLSGGDHSVGCRWVNSLCRHNIFSVLARIQKWMSFSEEKFREEYGNKGILCQQIMV